MENEEAGNKKEKRWRELASANVFLNIDMATRAGRGETEGLYFALH